MNIIELMQNRKSCRAYLDKPIEDEVLNQLLDAAVCAPSSGGFQNYSIIKVTNKETKVKLAELCGGQNFIGRAPVDLVFCMDFRREERLAKSYKAVPNQEYTYEELMMRGMDVAIAAQTLCMAAESMGIGSVFIGNVLNRQDEVSELLNLPEKVAPVVLVPLGYPKYEGKISGKFPREIMVHSEAYEEKPIEELQEAFEQKYSRWKMKPNPEMLDVIAETAEACYGKEYSEEVRRITEENEVVNPLSYWYGYFYSNHSGVMTNEEMWKFMKDKKLNFENM